MIKTDHLGNGDENPCAVFLVDVHYNHRKSARYPGLGNQQASAYLHRQNKLRAWRMTVTVAWIHRRPMRARGCWCLNRHEFALMDPRGNTTLSAFVLYAVGDGEADSQWYSAMRK